MLLLFITVLVLLIRFFVYMNNDNDVEYPGNNIIADFDCEKSNYKIFRDDDNDLLGVKDDKDRNIIEPQWNNIYFLNSGRFAVQKKDGDTLKIGIIDNDENCIQPFIYDKLVSVSDDFVVGYFGEEKEFALLDTSGNILLNKPWTSFEYYEENDIITLKDSSGSYDYKYENNNSVCCGVNFSRSVGKYTVNYSSKNPELIESIIPEKIYSIYDTACIYLNFLISGNKEDISDITNEQYFNSLASNDFFENCEINEIDNINIDISEEDMNAYTLSTEITYNYKDDYKTIDNLKSLISLSFISDENKSIILKSINKEEL